MEMSCPRGRLRGQGCARDTCDRCHVGHTPWPRGVSPHSRTRTTHLAGGDIFPRCRGGWDYFSFLVSILQLWDLKISISLAICQPLSS